MPELSEIICLKGIPYLVIPQHADSNPTLYITQLSTVQPEMYDLIYDKYTNNLYNKDN